MDPIPLSYTQCQVCILKYSAFFLHSVEESVAPNTNTKEAYNVTVNSQFEFGSRLCQWCPFWNINRILRLDWRTTYINKSRPIQREDSTHIEAWTLLHHLQHLTYLPPPHHQEGDREGIRNGSVLERLWSCKWEGKPLSKAHENSQELSLLGESAVYDRTTRPTMLVNYYRRYCFLQCVSLIREDLYWE